MKDINKDLERFLLGDLSEEERDKLEAQFFADDELFEQLLASEDVLFDRHVNDELSDREAANFQKRFAVTPQQKNRIEFARALKIKVAEIEGRQKTTASQTPSGSWWRSLLTLVGLQGSHMQLAFAAMSVVLLLSCA